MLVIVTKYWAVSFKYYSNWRTNIVHYLTVYCRCVNLTTLIYRLPLFGYRINIHIFTVVCIALPHFIIPRSLSLFLSVVIVKIYLTSFASLSYERSGPESNGPHIKLTYIFLKYINTIYILYIMLIYYAWLSFFPSIFSFNIFIIDPPRI